MSFDIRVKFSKRANYAYLGHLDLMRFFQKALRRAGLPLRYSAGFHPHPIMSFAQPLSVGHTSDGEYMDVSLTGEMDPAEIISAVNAVTGEGVRILDVEILPEKAANAMSLVSAATYIVYFKRLEVNLTDEEYDNGISGILSSDQILYEKTTKKGSRTEDIRPWIFEFERKSLKEIPPGFLDASSDTCFYLYLQTGSQGNLPAAFPVNVLMKSLGVKAEDYTLGIHRLELFLGKSE